MCANIYIFFKAELGDNITEPTHGPNLAKFKLVDVFTSVTDQHQKDGIINAFTKDSQLRIVIATVAFGVGIDCPDIRQIVHIGLLDNIESYIQDTGQAGRNGQPSLARLHHAEESSKEYRTNNDQCRRDFPFRDMDEYHHVDMCFVVTFVHNHASVVLVMTITSHLSFIAVECTYQLNITKHVNNYCSHYNMMCR